MSETPFDDDDCQWDDYDLGGGYADGKTTKDIVDENSFPDVPVGRNDFFAKRVEFKLDAANGNIPLVSVDSGFIASTLDGPTDTKVAYHYREAIITWALVSDPKVQIKEFVRLQPDDEEEAEIFATCTRNEGDKKRGFFWNKYRHMISAMGYDIEDGSIPREARVFRGWKFWPDGSPRIVSLDIGNQKTRDSGYTELKLGNNGKPYKQVNMFSHMRSHDTLVRLGEAPPESEPEAPPEPEPQPQRQVTPQRQAAPQPARQPAPQQQAPRPAAPQRQAAPQQQAPAVKPAKKMTF